MGEELIATEQFIRSGKKKLRCGITTGSCAAIASLASTKAIFEGAFPAYAKITTPKGWIALAEIKKMRLISKTQALCAVQKDGGDDADATDGLLIYADVSVSPASQPNQLSVRIFGGKGIGVVTKAGLDQKIGLPAINSVPRAMIEAAVKSVCVEHNFSGTIDVVISAPLGKEIARHTFNPVLGIEGGISILGTSGVVEPMSESALVEALDVETRVIAESLRGKKIRPLIITPGNFGLDFVAALPELSDIQTLKCSNFIGNAIDFAAAYEFTHVIFVGHAGKFVKLAGGIFNTHSHTADCRMELIASHAALVGAESFDIARIFDCATVDAALDILDESNITSAVMKSIAKAAQRRIAQRVQGAYKFAFTMFTNVRGVLAQTANFDFSELKTQ